MTFLDTGILVGAVLASHECPCRAGHGTPHALKACPLNHASSRARQFQIRHPIFGANADFQAPLIFIRQGVLTPDGTLRRYAMDHVSMGPRE